MKHTIFHTVCVTVLLCFCTYKVLGIRLAEQKCQDYRKTIAALSPAPAMASRTNEFVTPSNGLPAMDGEFPHQVLVGQWFYEDEDDTAFIMRCSGALISDQYVLVSGHCFWALAGDEVSLGRHDYTRNSSFPELLIKRGSLIMFPGFDELTVASYNDIGLIRLEESVTFSSHVYPICLWTDDKPLDLSHLISTGFRMGKQVNDTQDTQLMKLRMRRVPNEDCTQVYAGNKYFPQGVSDKQLCVEAPVDWKSTCEGDVGELLQTVEKGSVHGAYRLIGLEGKGVDCDEVHRKIVFTKIDKYLDWIESVVWKS
ncbi:serine protease snake-like [Anopheles nili]|uniref:serine protease snake-like n=1 Tax=Anopheles nili TaxID=185578 RepID=UPI00237AE17A|nr:serine protease snake-like [Anopheles nili]